MKLKKGHVYQFEWNDTYTYQGWHNMASIEAKTCEHGFQTTVGFYLKTISEWHVIAMHYNAQEGFDPFGNICWIPKGCVISAKKLN